MLCVTVRAIPFHRNYNICFYSTMEQDQNLLEHFSRKGIIRINVYVSKHVDVIRELAWQRGNPASITLFYVNQNRFSPAKTCWIRQTKDFASSSFNNQSVLPFSFTEFAFYFCKSSSQKNVHFFKMLLSTRVFQTKLLTVLVVLRANIAISTSSVKKFGFRC